MKRATVTMAVMTAVLVTVGCGRAVTTAPARQAGEGLRELSVKLAELEARDKALQAKAKELDGIRIKDEARLTQRQAELTAAEDRLRDRLAKVEAAERLLAERERLVKLELAKLPAPVGPKPPAVSVKTKVTRENFDRLKIGNSQAEVTALLGKPDGEEVDDRSTVGQDEGRPVIRPDKRVTARWRTDQLAVTVWFRNGALVTKSCDQIK